MHLLSPQHQPVVQRHHLDRHHPLHPVHQLSPLAHQVAFPLVLELVFLPVLHYNIHPAFMVVTLNQTSIQDLDPIQPWSAFHQLFPAAESILQQQAYLPKSKLDLKNSKKKSRF